MTRIQKQLRQETGRDPYAWEIADKMKISPAKVIELQEINQNPISLETPIGEEEDSQLSDFLEDINAINPFEATVSTLLHEDLVKALNFLSERERKIITLRYGLNGTKHHTLEEVGQEMDISRERVRQIENKTIAKIQLPCRKEKLRNYLRD